MTAQERMAVVLKENPTFGREKLARAAQTSGPTAQRFLKKWKKEQAPPKEPPPPQSSKYDFLENLLPHEIEAFKKSVLSAPKHHTPHFHAWSKTSFKFAFIADTHNGHKLAHLRWWNDACKLIEQEKCDFALHGGDITEGMSGRPGHIYELDQIGVSAQVRETVERFKQLPCPMKGITGNHDGWQFKQAGIDPGTMIADALPGKFEYLGMDEADIEVQGVKIKLWHGGDGSSYATSYRTQKFVEGLTGGEKPHILLSGHAHKSVYHCCRNVMVFEGGTLCGQTGWMRGKKLAAHCGFWIIEVWPAPQGGIERLQQMWVPFFV
jgi:predicted phosphodiesterase